MLFDGGEGLMILEAAVIRPELEGAWGLIRLLRGSISVAKAKGASFLMAYVGDPRLAEIIERRLDATITKRECTAMYKEL